MKRLLAFFLIFTLLLSGCGNTVTAPSQALSDPELISADALLAHLLAVVPEGSESPAVAEQAELEANLVIYGIDPVLVESCAVARLGGSRVFELAVIDLTARSTQVEEALLDYLLRRQGDFTGYAPDQADIAEDSKLFAVDGDLRLVLAITEDPGAVTDALTAVGYTRVTEVESARTWEDTPSISNQPAAVTTTGPEHTTTSEPSTEPSVEPSEEPSLEPSPEPSEEPEPSPTFVLPVGWKEYVPPNTDDMTIYDTSAILAAWETGSTEGLSADDLQIYERCVQIICERITDGMSDYEKEWAIYSWLIREVSYDWRHNDPILVSTTPRSSFTPYGPLIKGTAVCLGFASAFQLFMDMLEVECITVLGAAFDSSGDHAWNMVKLNGEWYCVDSTWDLGRSTPERCGYFNVTSDRMAKTDHQWDYENTPMATATDGGK